MVYIKSKIKGDVLRNLFFRILFFTITTFSVYSLDIGLRVTPAAFIPLGDDVKLNIEGKDVDIFSIGGGLFVNGDIDLFQSISIGPEFGFFVNSITESESSVSFIAGGINLSYFFYPISRMKIRAGGAGGVYRSIFEVEDESYAHIDYWWKAYGEIGYRFSPSISLLASVGYNSMHQGSEKFLYTGLYTGLSLDFSFDTSRKTGSDIVVSIDQPESVFPLFYTIYKESSAGALIVKNNGQAEIRNIAVSFRAGRYTSSVTQCGSLNVLRKRKTAEFPLYIDFSKSIQNFTENGQLSGEVIVDYEFLGRKEQSIQSVNVSVYNRNTFKWIDSNALASYISPNSTEVLEISKYLVGIARNNLKSGLNRNMQFAMYLFDGLNTGGLSLSNDKDTPYLEYHNNPELLDYIQYPVQTLSFRTGDYDDIGLLYAACLESAGVSAAIIPIKNDFIVAFSLDITSKLADNLFDDKDKLLFVGDNIWIPLSISSLREGFINSWYEGVESITDAVNAGEEFNFIILKDAWGSYPPAGFSDIGLSFNRPNEDLVVRAVNINMLRYIAAEFNPKIIAVREKIRNNGGSIQLYNQLGLLYIRANMYNEAKNEYGRSAAMNSHSAMMNLGNIYLLERNFETAGMWFKRLLELDPNNVRAKKGMDAVLIGMEG